MATKGLFAYHFRRPLHRNWEPRIRHVTVAQEAEGTAVMETLVGPDPATVHRNLGEGTVEYWGKRSHRLPYCSFWRFVLFGGLEWSEGNPEAPHETYSTIRCGTFRKENAPTVIEPGERTGLDFANFLIFMHEPKKERRHQEVARADRAARGTRTPSSTEG